MNVETIKKYASKNAYQVQIPKFILTLPTVNKQPISYFGANANNSTLKPERSTL